MMNIPFKDYYAILHLSRDASESDIKNGYRKLARKHHPDLFPAGMKKGAEERFKEINEAYDVLKDPAKKRMYDRLYTAWQERTRSPFSGEGFRRKWDRERVRPTRHWAWREKSDVLREETEPSSSFSDFFQSLFKAGEEKEETGRKHRGRSSVSPAPGEDIESEITLTLEEAAYGTLRRVPVKRESRCLFCQGRGFMGHKTCSRCRGAGRILEDKELTVKIPAGVRNGDRVRLTGQGAPGIGGGAMGNRYMTVRFAEHDLFHLASDHLEMTLAILPWEAALGTDRKISTLYGDVILKVPAGTQNGQQFRLRGKGLPIRKGGKEDLYVRVDIIMPSSMTAEEREHYMELARLAKKR